MPPWVLVVEDDAPTRGLYREILTRELGLSISEANDGEAAFDALDRAETRPALVLVDLMLPGLNAETFMRALRARFGPALPVMVVSGMPADQAEVAAARAEADRLISKPFDIEIFMDEVRRAVWG